MHGTCHIVYKNFRHNTNYKIECGIGQSLSDGGCCFIHLCRCTLMSFTMKNKYT